MDYLAFNNLFQFLLGRLKTSIGVHRVNLEFAFQFLLGRLKTTGGKAVVLNVIPVSIPAR